MIGASEGKVAVVAGGSGVIGSAVVRTLLDRGYRVVSLSRRRIATGGAIAHPNLIWGKCDVTRARSVSAAASAVRRRFGQQGGARYLDTLVYSVGHVAQSTLTEEIATPLQAFSVARYADYLRLYPEGFMRFVNTFLGSVREGGHIVSIGSALSLTCPPGWHASHYLSAKAAQDELALGYRDRDPLVRARKILVHRIAPTRVDCAFHRGHAHLSGAHRFVTPDEIAEETAAALRGGRSVDRTMIPEGVLRIA